MMRVRGYEAGLVMRLDGEFVVVWLRFCGLTGDIYKFW